MYATKFYQYRVFHVSNFLFQRVYFYEFYFSHIECSKNIQKQKNQKKLLILVIVQWDGRHETYLAGWPEVRGDQWSS